MEHHNQAISDRVLQPERLAELEATALLDSPVEETFDRFTRLASVILKTPVSLVSLVDRDRQFFKSSIIQHTPNGGKISVLAAANEGNAVLFSVTDTGYGIPKAAFEQIFDCRVDRIKSNWIKGTSTGLGLPFSQMTVEAHGGSIWVESDIGRGTTFYLTIPLS